MTDQAEGSALSKQTGVTIGLGMVVLTVAVSAAWWFGQWTGQDRAWKDGTDLRLKGIEATVQEAIREGTANRWSSIDMLRWAHRMQEANPDMKVPEPFQ